MTEWIKDTGNGSYEEISLHLLDKPNIGKLTHSVKMEHVMGWKINEGFHSKMCIHLRKKKKSQRSQKSHHFFYRYLIFPSLKFWDIFPHMMCHHYGTKLFKYIYLFIYFIHSFLAVHLSLMLCLKLCFQHLSSITWQRHTKNTVFRINAA